MDIADSLRVRVVGDGVLRVVYELISFDPDFLQCIEEGIDGPVALAMQLQLLILIADASVEIHPTALSMHRVLFEGVAQKLIGLGDRQVFLVKQSENLAGKQLGAQPVCLALDDGAKLGCMALGRL